MPAPKKRPILDGITHGTTGYRKGCGCAKCRGAKSAERADERRRRAERAKQDVPVEASAAPAAPPPPPPGSRVGPVEQAVRDELEQHDGAPGLGALRAVAIRLAQEIDDGATPSVSGSASTLLRYLTEIRKASRQVDGELAELLAELGEPA